MYTNLVKCAINLCLIYVIKWLVRLGMEAEHTFDRKITIFIGIQIIDFHENDKIIIIIFECMHNFKV